jgi:Na+/H+ antiporter NhaD/arsenite permease-like protein
MSQVTTSFQRAFQYTLFLSVLYIIFKFFGVDAPKGSEFLSYIVPMVLTNVIIIAFPVLFVIFYFKNGNTLENIKDNILEKHDPEIKNQEMLREYHGMLKEGIITQEEFDSIKKKYLKELHKG